MTVVGTDEESKSHYHANMTIPFTYPSQDSVDKYNQMAKIRFYNRTKSSTEEIGTEE